MPLSAPTTESTPEDALLPDDGTPPRIGLRDDEGAQAMEYAMLTGAGVSLVTVMSWLVRQPWFEEAMEQLFSGLLDTLAERIGSLLPALGSGVIA